MAEGRRTWPPTAQSWDQSSWKRTRYKPAHMGPATGWWWRRCRRLPGAPWRFYRGPHQYSHKHICKMNTEVQLDGESNLSSIYCSFCHLNPWFLNSNTHLHSQSLMPLSKCLKKTSITQFQGSAWLSQKPQNDFLRLHTTSEVQTYVSAKT